MKNIHERILSFVILALTILFLNACVSRQAAQTISPSELTIEEYPLQSAPAADPLSFTPVQGLREEILAKHQREREMSFPDNSTLFKGQPAFSVQLGNENYVAVESFTTTVTDQGTSQKVMIQVLKEGQTVFSADAGDASPINNLRGLWTYSDHWVLEFAQVTLDLSTNESPLEPAGRIIQDGESMNDRNGNEQTFGFQLIKGRPYYFFQQNGEIGISYDGQQVPLGYTQVPHYLCCSDAALNPRIAPNMVAFFALRGQIWYYVEIGVFE